MKRPIKGEFIPGSIERASYRGARSPSALLVDDTYLEERRNEESKIYEDDRQKRKEAIQKVQVGQVAFFDKKKYIVVGVNKIKGVVRLGSEIGGRVEKEVGVLSPVLELATAE